MKPLMLISSFLAATLAVSRAGESTEESPDNSSFDSAIVGALQARGKAAAQETRARAMAEAARAAEMKQQDFVAARLGRGTAGRILLIRATPFESGAAARIEEDLSIMGRILEKTLEQEVRSSPVKKLGLVLKSMGRDKLQAIYLEGYGAIFLLRVHLLLMPPPRAKDSAAEEDGPADSTWDQAREELYGSGGGGPGRSGQSEPEAVYEEALVTRLKLELLKALKNASRIRHLKEDDYVNITVLGDSTDGRGAQPGTSIPAGKPGRYGGVSGGFGMGGFGGGMGGGMGMGGLQVGAGQFESLPGEAGGRVAFGASLASPRGTTLTIRVKKADADAFAGGKLDLEEFQKRVLIHAYEGNAANEAFSEMTIQRSF